MGLSIVSLKTTYQQLGYICHYRQAQDTKMFNKVAVLTAVLVCAAVFLSCVAADGGDCERIQDQVDRLLRYPCSLTNIMEDFYQLERDAELVCSDVWGDIERLREAIARCIE